MTLDKVKCPSCGELVAPINGAIKAARSYDDCLRRCEKCGIGFSNSKNNPSVIYKNYLDNIPELLQNGLEITLNNSINELNRKNKRNKIGFSTSEDALTWSFFKYFVVGERFEDLLNLRNLKSDGKDYDIYLWGVPISSQSNKNNFIEKFREVSRNFNETSSKMTEPDVMIKLSDKIVFIEVKYLSANEIKTGEEFAKYLIPDVEKEKLIESGHYELFRNWAFASKLSYGNDFILINLAPKKLFSSKNQSKLIQFENSLKSTKGKFVKLTWEEILEKVNNKEYDMWFKNYLNKKLDAIR